MIKARLTEKECIKEILPMIIRKAINEGVKNDYLDLIVNEIHRYHSGITDIYRINSKAYTTVMLFNKANPELFRESIPADAYQQLLAHIISPPPLAKELEDHPAYKNIIDFAQWYSGMEREKVIKAFDRYQREVFHRKTQK